MLRTRKIVGQEPTPYATQADFRRIFESDRNRLYLLSLLLTGDHVLAERCFVGGLGESSKHNPVFKAWAQSWARRTVIQNAIRMVRPRPTDSKTSGSTKDRDLDAEPGEIAAIIELPAFERFVFVMSVLERYSDQECSLLLACMRSELIAARTRALQRIGSSPELRGQLVGVGSEKQSQGDPDPTLREVWQLAA